MTALDRFVLPADVVISPIARLPAALRAQVEHGEGDCAVTRPRTRSQSSVVDAQTAALLERFRDPATIVDAVIAYSSAAGLDPGATLDDAFETLRGFVADGVLVAADSALAQPIETSLAPGGRVGGFELLEAVHVLADTEVHRARGDDGAAAAVKFARDGAAPWVRAAFARERQLLGRLGGEVAPRLLEAGDHDGRPYLAIAWCDGIDVHTAAAQARLLPGPAGRVSLLELAAQVTAAYAGLHAAGVLHGDVHPRNAIARPDGTVTLIDFGLATDAHGGDRAVVRGGVDFFLDPESAAARLAGAAPAALTPAAEQYALGALLYLLLTGAHTHAFSLEPEQMLRQLTELAPLPFADHGVDDLPAVERTLARALARTPAQRWASVAELLGALRAAAAADTAAAAAAEGAANGDRPRPPRSPAAASLLDAVLGRVEVPGELFGGGLPAPTASLMNGGAGIAYALLRIACARDDAELLARADLWSAQATRAARTDPERAFYNAELEIVPEVFGDCSFYHHSVGVHAVAALVAIARGDDVSTALALRAFVAAIAAGCKLTDVTFGRAGLLIGCAELLEALPPAFDATPLRSAADTIRDQLWRELRRQRPLAERPALGALGAAHGWAGFLHGLLRWERASGAPAPEEIDERLDQLAALAAPAGRGLRWSYEADGARPHGGLEASWCNGAAGYVELWLLAHHRSGEERFALLAQRAAWTAFEGGADVGGDLCCGFAGRAYALLGLHRAGGDEVWRARARALAERAAARVAVGSLRRDALYKGEVGVALLLAELEHDDPLGMPAFA